MRQAPAGGRGGRDSTLRGEQRERARARAAESCRGSLEHSCSSTGSCRCSRTTQTPICFSLPSTGTRPGRSPAKSLRLSCPAPQPAYKIVLRRHNQITYLTLIWHGKPTELRAPRLRCRAGVETFRARYQPGRAGAGWLDLALWLSSPCSLTPTTPSCLAAALCGLPFVRLLS